MKNSRIGIRLLSVLLLLLWGGILIYFHASGRLVSGEYLSKNGIFIPAVLAAGIGLVVMAIFNMATLGAEEGGCGHNHSCCDHDHDHDHGHHHDHSHETEAEPHGHGVLEESGTPGRVVAILLLTVPLTYAAIKSPDQYSANAVVNKGVYSNDYSEAAKGQGKLKADKSKSANTAAAPTGRAPQVTAQTPAPNVVPAPGNSSPAPPDGQQAKSLGAFTLADLKAQVPQSKEGNFMLDVPEIFYTAGDKEVQSVLEGQMVETVAQVLPEKVNNPKGTRLRIFRLLVQCCAADARPFSIPVEFGKTPPNFKDMTWVKVVGKLSFKSENNQIVPVLEAATMTEAAEPDSRAVF